jgi:hypothetical protein
LYQAKFVSSQVVDGRVLNALTLNAWTCVVWLGFAQVRTLFLKVLA